MARTLIIRNRRGIVALLGAVVILAAMTAPAAMGRATALHAPHPAGAPKPAHAITRHATVTGIAGSVVTLTAKDGWSRSVETAGLAITRAGAAATVGAITIGIRVDVREIRNAEGTYTITELRIVLDKVRGVVTGLGAGSFTVRIKDGSTRTVTFTGATVFQLDKTNATSAAVAVGLEASAQGTLTGTTLAAERVHLGPAHAGGTVLSISGSTITIGRGKHGQHGNVTVQVGGSTSYVLVGPKSAGPTATTLAAVVAGSRIDVRGLWNAHGSLAATTVRVHAPKVHAAKPHVVKQHVPKVHAPGVHAPKVHASKNQG